MTIAAGLKMPGVVCPHCKQGVPILDDLKRLPAEFEVECPHCGKTEIRRLDEIQTLVVASK
jgi:predicted RNA-binding Zn-ribbon protein involved in translation (DUF1610 family)